MTATSAEIQWFIAREGKQYGPVSDAEMQKLAELRHLKPGDLLWRPGFPEWRPATAVFPQPQPMQPKLSTQPPPASASQTQHANAAPYETQPARAEPQRHEPQAAPRPGFGGAPYETHQPVNQPGAHPAAGRPVAGQSATGQSPTTTGQGHGQPAPAANVGQQPMHNAQFPMPRQQFDPRRPGMQPGPGQGPVGSQPGQAQPPNMQRGPGAGPGMAQPQLGAAHGAEPMTAGRGKALAHVQPHQFEEETAAPAPRSRVRMLAAAVAVLLIAAGGGYILSTGGGSGLKAMMTAAGKPAAEVDPRAAPLDKLGDSTETLDANFQRTAMWVVVKKEFPEWYGDRLKEAAKLSADKSSEDAIAKHLAEALVALRRQHANDGAVRQHDQRLKDVATTFLDNLKTLATKSVGACYGFISQGETCARRDRDAAVARAGRRRCRRRWRPSSKRSPTAASRRPRTTRPARPTTTCWCRS